MSVCGYCQEGKTDLCPGEFVKFSHDPGGDWSIEECRPESVLQEAQGLIAGARNTAYGPFEDDYRRTVAIFNAWTGHDLSVADGLRFMRAVKMSREIASPHIRDHYVDGAGYLAGQARVQGVDT